MSQANSTHEHMGWGAGGRGRGGDEKCVWLTNICNVSRQFACMTLQYKSVFLRFVQIFLAVATWL